MRGCQGHTPAEPDVFWFIRCALHGCLALRGVTVLAGAAMQPPSLAESGFLAEALGQPSRYRQAAASSRFCGEWVGPLCYCLSGSWPLVHSIRP